MAAGVDKQHHAVRAVRDDEPGPVGGRRDAVEVLPARHGLQLQHGAHARVGQRDDAGVELIRHIRSAAYDRDALGLRHNLRQALDLARGHDAGDVPVAVLAHQHAAVVGHVEQVVGNVHAGRQQDDGIT